MLKPTNENTNRKQYSAPKLITYGDILEITRTVGANGNLDGQTGGGPKNSVL